MDEAEERELEEEKGDEDGDGTRRPGENAEENDVDEVLGEERDEDDKAEA